jgi:hypothetical protein
LGAVDFREPPTNAPAKTGLHDLLAKNVHIAMDMEPSPVPVVPQPFQQFASSRRSRFAPCVVGFYTVLVPCHVSHWSVYVAASNQLISFFFFR